MEPIYFKEDKSEDSGTTESSSRQRRDSGSHVQTKERVDVEKLLRQKHDLMEEEPILWRVLLHNDHIHTFSYVVQSIVKVVGILTRAQAWEVVVHAHANDRATICKVWKSKAEQFCLGLQRQGLTASIVPDYEFNYYDYLRHQLGSTATGKKRDRESVQNKKVG
jgi:ATP-dependent Clp protease adapter protein ClpS